METIFRAIECGDHEKKRLAVFQLTYSTAEWWEVEEASMGTVALETKLKTQKVILMIKYNFWKKLEFPDFWLNTGKNYQNATDIKM